LFVYLHGYGSRAEDLHPIATALAATFPDAESLLPDGFASTSTGMGRQWWSVEGMTNDNRAQRVDAASREFERWLDAELASRSLGYEDVTLFGFSQGAALAVAVGSRRSVMAVVSFCGRPPAASDADVSTAFLLVHGAHDPFIPVSDATRFHATLRERGADVEFRLLAELGHGINRDAVELAREFVAARTRTMASD
jgi:phospholipase/carboxylesterase